MMGVIDDDDSFTHEVIDDDDSFVNDNTPNVDEAKLDTIDDDSVDVDKETKNELTKRGAVDPDGEVMEPQEEDSTNVELNENNNDNEPGLAPAAEDKKDSEAEGNDEAGEELHDVELAEKVEPSAPELDKSEKLTSFGGLCEASYFDVHKQVYKETNSYLKKHLKLVDYAEDWEKNCDYTCAIHACRISKIEKGT